KRQRLQPERADPLDVLAIGVERALGNRDRGRAEREDFLAPRLDLGVELFGRHHLVDEPHLKGFGGAVAAAQKPDLARAPFADQSRPGGRPPPRGPTAPPRAPPCQNPPSPGGIVRPHPAPRTCPPPIAYPCPLAIPGFRLSGIFLCSSSIGNPPTPRPP